MYDIAAFVISCIIDRFSSRILILFRLCKTMCIVIIRIWKCVVLVLHRYIIQKANRRKGKNLKAIDHRSNYRYVLIGEYFHNILRLIDRYFVLFLGKSRWRSYLINWYANVNMVDEKFIARVSKYCCYLNFNTSRLIYTFYQCVSLFANNFVLKEMKKTCWNFSSYYHIPL